MMQELRDLILDAQAGDAEAIEKLVEKFSELIQRECARYGVWQNPELSHADLIQEVMFLVWTKIGQFKGAENENADAMFTQWVRVTAQSVLKNMHRARNAKKRKPDEKIEVFDESVQGVHNRNHVKTASSIFSTKEQVERLNAAMKDTLDVEGREILNLRIVEGLSLREISTKLSLSYDQVRYKFKTSLEALERQIGPS